MCEKKHAITKTKRGVLIKSETDRISELPDDILSSIISYFNVRDAAIASVLSSRWRYLCTSMSKLEFDLDGRFRPDADARNNPKGACHPYKDTFIKRVNQFLHYYKGLHLVYFCFSFCLEQDSAYDIDQWVSFGVSMGAKDLYIFLSCSDCYVYDKICEHRNLYTLRAELFSHGNMAKVRNVHIRSCIMGRGVINQFSSVTLLHLSDLTLGAHEVESIHSCCLNVQSLTLERCTLIPILRITGSLHRLNFLGVILCFGLEEIELSARNLTHFDYSGDSPKFSFSGAPKLKQIFFRAPDKRTLRYIFSQLAKDLPLAETLLIYSTANWIQCLPEQMATFSKIKQLDFYSPKNIKLDVLKIISILQACPLMEKFHLVMYSVYPQKEIPGLPMPLDCVHKYLKEVHIGGFLFRASYIELAICMLEYGVALEHMVLFPQHSFYYGVNVWCGSSKRTTWDDGEREKVWSRLQDHSKSSIIIIR